MATQAEQETSEHEERDDAEPDDVESLPYDGGFVRLELPGTEPSESNEP